MEHFELCLTSSLQPSARMRLRDADVAEVLCGVPSSGNLEVLVEAWPAGSASLQCLIEVHTAVEGFRDTWQAVLGDFAVEHAAAGLRFTLNDVGATPAVVALRLTQAFEAWCQPAQGAGR